MRVATTNGQAAAEHIERAVVEWLRVELDDLEIGASDNFLDVGGHSLIFSKLNKFLADSFGVTLDQKATYSDLLSVAVAAVGPIDNANRANSAGLAADKDTP